LASLSRGRLDVVTLLHAATAGGHRSIGWPEAGRIAAGAIADLVTVRLDSPRTAGTTRSTALAHALFAASAADVVHVVASGRVLVANGEHVAIDVPRELGTILAELDGR